MAELVHDDFTTLPARDVSEMKPSFYQLPQKCSLDRQRARHATLQLQQRIYQLQLDPPTDCDGERFWLPARAQKLPGDENFGAAKLTTLLGYKLIAKSNSTLSQLLNVVPPSGSQFDYARLLRLMKGPPQVIERWADDVDFARQRLIGCNPLQLEQYPPKRPYAPLGDALLAAAGRALNQLGVTDRLATLESKGKLFLCDYRELAHPLFDPTADSGRRHKAPVCLFYTDEKGTLRPLAIQLSAVDPQVYTAVSPQSLWLYARSHVQAADGAYHEGPQHLLSTHLISEVFAIVTARQLHPHHPVAQLLSAHFRFNLAINDLARRDLLSIGGPIDLAIGLGVRGVLNLSRRHWSRWDFSAASPMANLEARGLRDTKELSGYLYRDDAKELYDAIFAYAGDIVACWYLDDADVSADRELQAWSAELAAPVGGNIPGFPSTIESRSQLGWALAEIIYRASAAHAALNNGQFARYGWVPNSPGAMRELTGSTTEDPFTEQHFWRTMPDRKSSLAQLGMAWVLSAPTFYSLVRAGEAPAFDPDLNPAASRGVGLFRRRLQYLSQGIRRRNDEINKSGGVPYADMDPYNVSRSTET